MRFGLDALIDPRLHLLTAESSVFYAGRTPGRGPGTPDELRAARAAAAPAPADPHATEEAVTVGGRVVTLRVLEPVRRAVRGVFLQLHGGGFYLGSAAADDVANRRLADALGLAVVSVDYRLAPEQPWPAAPDDCETAALWLAEHAQRRFGTARLAIGGFSAGATLAMTTLLRLRDRRLPVFDCAVLQFGTYDLSARTPAGRLIADEYFLRAYCGAAADRTHPDISPIYADLADLPPALVVVGAADILLEDNLAMAARLSAAGNEVELRVYPGAPHGFTGHPTPMARAAHADIDSFLESRLGSGERPR